MRYHLLCLLTFITSLSLTAQVQYGKLTYLRTTEITWESDNEIETPQDKQIKAMMAQMRSSGAFDKTYQATFSPTAFNCVEQKKIQAEATTELGNGNSITILSGDDEPVHFYTEPASGDVLNSDNIFDRNFLVSGTLPATTWTLTGEQVPPGENTAGLDLLIATGITATNDTIIAGYAPGLPVNVGPLNYYGLPGAIITLEIPNGKESIIYRVTNIELSTEPLVVTKPTEGKPISLEKFRKETEKRKKMMLRQYGQ